jgi:signal peptidase II
VSRPHLLFATVALTAFLLDQLSKTLVFHRLLVGQSLSILGDFFRITYILNPGGAFGTMIAGSSFYLVVSLLAIVFTVVFFIKSRPDSPLMRTGLALVLGGALGNVADRIRFGQVIDFLDFDFPDLKFSGLNLGFLQLPGFSLERWPIFNLADSAISVGAVLIVIYILRHREKGSATLGTEGFSPQD